MLGLYKSEREPTDMRLFLLLNQFSGPDAGSGNTPGPSLRVYTSGPVSFATTLQLHCNQFAVGAKAQDLNRG